MGSNRVRANNHDNVSWKHEHGIPTQGRNIEQEGWLSI
jgi:hypothetical protein